ncbi:DUF1877 family protein [Thermomonospora amylolytica]|nr:DUF1877 family protein [Thermomonospora amylolytica]
MSRHDAGEVTALLDHPDGRTRLRDAYDDLPLEPDPGSPHPLRELERIDTHRAWDTLHVLLTGLPNDGGIGETATGEAPARDVIMGGLNLAPAAGGSLWYSPVLLPPDRVRAVAEYLNALDRDALIRDRYAFLQEEWRYSFGGWGPDQDLDMVQSGVLAEVFDTVRAFYTRAATAANAVIKELG